jgi:hypothetical protein
MQAAARAADGAVWNTVEKYNSGGVFDEPEISTYLISQLDSIMTGQIGGLSWSSAIVRNGKGKAGEEKRIGADILLHVSVNTPTERYSKGVLIQAKKAEPYQQVPNAVMDELGEQCQKMLGHTPSAFVMSYELLKQRIPCRIGYPFHRYPEPGHPPRLHMDNVPVLP